MSGFRANSIVNRDGTGAPNFPNGIVATGATFTQVSSVNGTFSGNLTIGGTVSYQEVENIDAVGVVTAQQGIQVEANGLTVTGVGTFNNSIEVVEVTTADANGLNVTGVITATTLKGSGANLTGVLPTFSGTASGTLANGQTVIIKSDGTIAGVVTTGFTETVGSKVVFESGEAYTGDMAYDSSNDRIVIIYQDAGDSNKGKAVVGTVSGTSITFGTPVTFTSSRTFAANMGCAFDSGNNKVVIGYRDRDASDHGYGIVGTVSGTSISFGSATRFSASSTLIVKVVYDSNAERIVFVFEDGGDNNYGKTIVGTVSGTSISFSSEGNQTFKSANVDYYDATFDSSNNKVVIAYKASSAGKAIVGTVDTSDDTMTFGSEVEFYSSSIEWTKTVFDSTNNKVIVVYSDASLYGDAIVGTVSGTSISFGSATKINGSAQTQHLGLAYDSNAEKIVVSYQHSAGGDDGELRVGTVSGSSITFGSAIDFDGGSVRDTFAMFDSTNNKVVIAYGDQGNSTYGTAVVFQNESVSTNLTSTNFLGFSNAAYSDGDTATIQVTGAVDDAQSGLTTAKKHYVQNDGTLSTTAGSPSVEAGTAVSATKIIVKG